MEKAHGKQHGNSEVEKAPLLWSWYRPLKGEQSGVGPLSPALKPPGSVGEGV